MNSKGKSVRRYSSAPAGRFLSLPPVRVADAPVKKNIVTENINIFDFISLFRINTYDGGCFLSKACVVSADPDDPGNPGKTNLGTYRMQVKGKDKLGIQALPFHDIGLQLAAAEAENKSLPIAVCLGCAPLTTFMASTPIRYDQSEYDYVGALNNGVPMEITKAPTLDLDIPTGCEICIEGYIEPRVRELEGPFGEFPGSYSGARLQAVVKITAISYRDHPIFEMIIDATTPKAPEIVTRETDLLDAPAGTAKWEKILAGLLKQARK